MVGVGHRSEVVRVVASRTVRAEAVDVVDVYRWWALGLRQECAVVALARGVSTEVGGSGGAPGGVVASLGGGSPLAFRIGPTFRAPPRGRQLRAAGSAADLLSFTWAHRRRP